MHFRSLPLLGVPFREDRSVAPFQLATVGSFSFFPVHTRAEPHPCFSWAVILNGPKVSYFHKVNKGCSLELSLAVEIAKNSDSPETSCRGPHP
jgi:hypothetical protein